MAEVDQPGNGKPRWPSSVVQVVEYCVVSIVGSTLGGAMIASWIGPPQAAVWVAGSVSLALCAALILIVAVLRLDAGFGAPPMLTRHRESP